MYLELLDECSVRGHIETLQSQTFDVFLIAGDIGTATTVADYLALLAGSLQVPICFCLDNQDYYGGAISAVRAAVKEAVAGVRCLN